MKHFFTFLCLLVFVNGLTSRVQAQSGRVSFKGFQKESPAPSSLSNERVQTKTARNQLVTSPGQLNITTPGKGARLAAISSQQFNYSGSIVTYTVPSGVTSLTVEARGAEGGNSSNSDFRSGKGAVIIGTITVTPGQQLKVLAGEQPNRNYNGGGGGSFVTTSNNSPLIIAGGGGGSGDSNDSPNKQGQAVNNGASGAGQTAGNGGSAGSGGGNQGAVVSSRAAGGGGLLTDGQNAEGFPGTAGKAFINGGSGGGAGAYSEAGGFGGGGLGSGDYSGGGGGGYSGGGAGSGSTSGVGGGGGSYNAGTDQNNTAGTNSGNGVVIISYSCPVITPTLQASNNGILTCTNPTLTLTAGGGSNYSFSGPGLNQSGAVTTATATQKGDYTVVVSGLAGCPTASKTITVGENKTPPQNITLNKDGLLTCVKTSVQLSAVTPEKQAVTYQFSGPAVSNVNGSSASATAKGDYIVTVTRTDNGCSAQASTTVEQNITPPPAVQLTNDGPLTANKATVTLTANPTPGADVQYDFSNGTTQTTGSTATVTTPGTYSVTATRQDNGCTTTAQTTVLGAASPTACYGRDATISLTAPGSPTRYEWYQATPVGSPLRDGSAYSGTSTANLTVKNALTNGVYYVKVFYGDGSSATYGPFRVTVSRNCGARETATIEPGTELRISLMGNPLQGEALKALVEGAAGQRLHVELLDLSGKAVRQQVFESADSQQFVDWNLNGSGSGLYLLQAVSGAQRQTTKVVKP